MRSGAGMFVLGLGGALILTVTMCLAFAPGAKSQSAGDRIEVGVSEDSQAEIHETLKIKRKRGQNRTSVVALKPGDMPSVKAGQTVRGLGDVQVSVTCTEPTSKCIGKIYRYSPKFEAQYVLADSPDDIDGQEIGEPAKKVCSQSYPNRNHHCTLILDQSGIATEDCARCSLNMVMTTWHRKAKKKEILVVGNDSSSGVKQGKASISATVSNTDTNELGEVLRSTDKLVNKADVVDRDEGSKQTVLASVRVNNLQQGEALIIDARAKTDIKHLDYNVLTQAEVVISEKGPRSEDNSGVPVLAVTKRGKVAVQSGFNCTRGKSPYRSPCKVRKVGAAFLERPAVTKPNNFKGDPVPLYVNLVGSYAAVFGDRYGKNDQVKVKSVDLRVRRISNGN